MESLKKSALGRDPVRDQTQPGSQACQEMPFIDKFENTVSALKTDSNGGDLSQLCSGKVRPVNDHGLSGRGLEEFIPDDR